MYYRKQLSGCFRYVPKLHTIGSTVSGNRRTVEAHSNQLYSTIRRRQQEEGSDVIPSVSNDNLWISATLKQPHTEGLTEEIATNIDSGTDDYHRFILLISTIIYNNNDNT